MSLSGLIPLYFFQKFNSLNSKEPRLLRVYFFSIQFNYSFSKKNLIKSAIFFPAVLRCLCDFSPFIQFLISFLISSCISFFNKLSTSSLSIMGSFYVFLNVSQTIFIRSIFPFSFNFVPSK